MRNRIEKSIELQLPISRIWQALINHNEFGEWFTVKVNTPFMKNEITYGYLNYLGYEYISW